VAKSAPPANTTVYALVGSDAYLQTLELRRILSALPPDTQRIDVQGDESSVSLADVLDELRAFSMFGSGKAVVVREADDFISKYREQLEDYVASPVDANLLILRCSSLPKTQRIAKAIDKLGGYVPCEPPKDAMLPQWIVRHAKTAHDLVVQPDAAAALADLIGADLGRLDNEIARLALQTDGQPLTVDVVKTGVSFQRDQEMWHMTDELTAGRPAEAVRRWRHLLQSDPSSEYRGITWLGIWVEKATKALAMKRAKMSPEAIAKAAKIWPTQNVFPLLKAAEQLGDAGLARATDLLTDLDKSTKSGLGNAADGVETFIASLSS
jgi:DNA polymerase-3 subunit delta